MQNQNGCICQIAGPDTQALRMNEIVRDEKNTLSGYISSVGDCAGQLQTCIKLV